MLGSDSAQVAIMARLSKCLQLPVVSLITLFSLLTASVSAQTTVFEPSISPLGHGDQAESLEVCSRFIKQRMSTDIPG
jgi:hypothetical protein